MAGFEVITEAQTLYSYASHALGITDGRKSTEDAAVMLYLTRPNSRLDFLLPTACQSDR